MGNIFYVEIPLKIFYPYIEKDSVCWEKKI